MSDILTSYSRDDTISHDYLSEFLTKLARFGIDQCLHFTHLVGNKQKLSTLHTNYQNQQIHLNYLLTEIQVLQNDFYETLSSISSSDDPPNEQLLFVKLQNYLSKFVQISFRFKSFNLSMKEMCPEPSRSNILDPPSSIISDRHSSKMSTSSHIPEIRISSSSSLSVCSTDDLNNNIDIGKYWKFANIIHTRFQISLIASNSHVILCYNNHNHFLHFILVTGQFQGDIKWKYEPIIDILWCSSIDRYVALSHHSIYTIQYNRSSRTNPILVNQVLVLKKLQLTRIACNDCNILLYITEQQSSSIEIYDYQFNREKTFDNLTNKQLPINSPIFCCTNTLIAFTDKYNVLISCFPYITPKKTSLLLFDIDTLELRYTIDLNDCLNIYSMKCLSHSNIFFALSDEKILWIIAIDQNETTHIAKKTFYTNQTEMCIINNQDLLLINVNAGSAIQMIKYRKIQQ
ncbi:hypothetical protein I4U23_020841 [Adineta vaga]|nr:hypothetical protein I4U23_020841 [Adineta vaga]